MVPGLEVVGFGVIAVAGIGYLVVGLATDRGTEFPGKRSFVAACALLGTLLISAATLLAITRLDPAVPWVVTAGLGLLFVSFAAGLLAPLAWLRFALLFTGLQVPTDWRTVLRIGLPVIGAIVIVALSIVVPVLRFDFGLPIPPRTVAILRGGRFYVTTVTALYLAALLVAGVSLVGWTTYTYRHLSSRAGALLGVGVTLPWVAAVVPQVTGLFVGEPLATYHVAVGSVAGFVTTALAIYRHDLFEAVPAAGTVGRDVTVGEMTAPVVVVDERRRVLDLNRAFEGAFDTVPAAVGRPLSAVIDETSQLDVLFEPQQDETEFEIGHRTYRVRASELRDEYDRTLGHSLVYHDVTERTRREQRIQVLNRVLRHNLRNDLNVVKARAELLEQETADPGTHAAQIQTMTTGLLDVGEKAQNVEEVVATRGEAPTVPLSAAIDRALDGLQSAYPDCTIELSVGIAVEGADSAGVVDGPATDVGDTPVNGRVLSAVLRELVENACEHNDAAEPRVELRATLDRGEEWATLDRGEEWATLDRGDKYPVVITVTDNGPGIPDHEIAPIREGTETDLEHGSGLGLWLVEWGVTSLGGVVEFADHDPTGTVATVRLDATRNGP